MSHYWREIMRLLDHMGPRGWFLVLASMIIVALVCMRGYGSRSGY